MIAIELENDKTQKIWSSFSGCRNDFTICLSKLYFHTIEACVNVNRYESIDELELFVLEAVTLLEEPDTENINSLLHIGRKTIKPVIKKLRKSGLLSQNSNEMLKLTTAGKNTLKTGEMITLKTERCVFNFLDGSNEFLKINDPKNKFLTDLKPYETGTKWNFDIKHLEKCIKQTDQWKKQRQFPTEIQELIKPDKKTLSDINLIVVDKARYINCAILITFEDDKPLELSAFSLSKNGRSISQEAVFTVKGESQIHEIFPDVKKISNKKQTKASLSTLFEQFDLNTVKQENIQIQDSHITITPSDIIDTNWSKFYWQNLQQNLYCNTVSEKTSHLRKVNIQSQNGELKTVDLLFKINALPENFLTDIATYKNWLKENDLEYIEIQELSCLAWQLGKYSLSYNLSQLEDMIDADV